MLSFMIRIGNGYSLQTVFIYSLKNWKLYKQCLFCHPKMDEPKNSVFFLLQDLNGPIDSVYFIIQKRMDK
jgi:hypothetical protein